MRSMVDDIMQIRQSTKERRVDLLQNLLDAREKRGGIGNCIDLHVYTRFYSESFRYIGQSDHWILFVHAAGGFRNIFRAYELYIV